MKKNTALTIGAIALLSAGIAFGVKFKQKKDFEKTLKTILIPDAEKQLDDLLRQDATLKDSVDFYNHLLLIQSSEADGQRMAEKYNRLRGIDHPNMYRELKDLSKMLDLMDKEWDRAYAKINTQHEKYSREAMPKVLIDECYYVSSGMASGKETKQLLLEIKYYVNNFDNSLGFIGSKCVKQINDQIAELLPQVEEQIRLEEKKEKTAKKLEEIKTGKSAVEKRIGQQQKKLHVLKNTKISKLMREHRNK